MLAFMDKLSLNDAKKGIIDETFLLDAEIRNIGF